MASEEQKQLMNWRNKMEKSMAVNMHENAIAEKWKSIWEVEKRKGEEKILALEKGEKAVKESIQREIKVDIRKFY